MHNQNKNKNLEYHSVVSRAHASTKVVDVAKFIVTIKEAPGNIFPCRVRQYLHLYTNFWEKG